MIGFDPSPVKNAPAALHRAIESYRSVSSGFGEHSNAVGINAAVADWTELSAGDRWAIGRYLTSIGFPVERPASNRYARFVAQCVTGRPILHPADPRTLSRCWTPSRLEIPEDFRPTAYEGVGSIRSHLAGRDPRSHLAAVKEERPRRPQGHPCRHRRPVCVQRPGRGIYPDPRSRLPEQEAAITPPRQRSEGCGAGTPQPSWPIPYPSASVAQAGDEPKCRS